jgi:hypothetical protein
MQAPKPDGADEAPVELLVRRLRRVAVAQRQPGLEAAREAGP